MFLGFWGWGLPNLLSIALIKLSSLKFNNNNNISKYLFPLNSLRIFIPIKKLPQHKKIFKHFLFFILILRISLKKCIFFARFQNLINSRDIHKKMDDGWMERASWWWEQVGKLFLIKILRSWRMGDETVQRYIQRQKTQRAKEWFFL